jgi:hypothetical protein
LSVLILVQMWSEKISGSLFFQEKGDEPIWMSSHVGPNWKRGWNYCFKHSGNICSNIRDLCNLPMHCIYIVLYDSHKNSDYFSRHHKLVGLCKGVTVFCDIGSDIIKIYLFKFSLFREVIYKILFGFTYYLHFHYFISKWLSLFSNISIKIFFDIWIISFTALC